MKNTLIIVGIISIFLLGIFLGDNFGGGGNSDVTSDTIYQDTGTHSVIIKPVPYRVDSLIPGDTVYLDRLVYVDGVIDTSALIEDYLRKRYYKQDTAISDVSISIEQLVLGNRLISTNLNVKNNRATTINKIYPPKFSLIAGGGFGSSNLHLGGGIEYKNSIIIYNHNFLNEYSKHTISYYYKFNFNRKKLAVL